MSSLHPALATFDPLSASVDDESKVEPQLAALTAAAPQPAVPTSEYDSFMTARSNMSYMTASAQGGSASAMSATPAPAATTAPTTTAAAIPPTSGLFRRLPDRAPQPATSATLTPTDPYNPFSDSPRDYSPQAPKPQLPPLQPDDSKPFASQQPPQQYPYPSAPPQPQPVQPPPPQPQSRYPMLPSARLEPHRPLSFADDLGSGSTGTEPRGGVYGNVDVAFMMPLDLYDTPDSLAGGAAAPATPPVQPAAATASVPPPLPPLHDFTRGFSRMLPVSEDPISPPGGSVTPHAGWYGTDGASAVGAAARGSASGGGPSHAGGSDVNYNSYAAAALLTNTVSVHSPRKAVGPSRIPGATASRRASKLSMLSAGLSEPYTVYRVTSRGATSPETTVDRRFRDVVALGDLLQALYPGCFLPPRPSRNAVEARRMQLAFIEERRLGMERFLGRLVVHPVYGPSEAVQVWLHSPAPDVRASPEWLRLLPAAPPGIARSTARLLFQVVGRERTVPSPLELTRSASEMGDMYRLVRERTAQLRGVVNKVQPSPAEERLREEEAALKDRSEALLLLSRRANQFVGRGAKAAAATEALAGALEALAGADEKATGAAGAAAEAAERGPGDGRSPVGPTPFAALKAAAEGCRKVGKLYGVATDASAKHLVPLHDWLAAGPGAAAGLAARERCLLTAATLEADEKEARSKLAEAEARTGGAGAASGGGAAPSAAARKAEALRLHVAQLAAAVAAARDEYDRVYGRNAAELAAFKAHMSRELADAVRELALVQLAGAQKAHEMWRDTAATLATLAAAAAAPPPAGVTHPALGVGVRAGMGSGGMGGQTAYGTATAGGY